MLHIFICEDDSKYRESIETIINTYIVARGGDIKLALSTDNPIDILNHSKKTPTKEQLYFIDINLQHEMSGIKLAVEIKKNNILAKIVFVTMHSELSYLVFVHKIEALDYVVKGIGKEVESRITECITTAYNRYAESDLSKDASDYFKVKAGNKIFNIHIDEILFFETHVGFKHRVILHTINAQIEFRTSLSEIATSNDRFFRCHKSFVVNTKNIKRIDKNKNELEMKNGEVVLIATRKVSELLKVM